MRHRFETHFIRRQKTHSVFVRVDKTCHCGGPVHFSPVPADDRHVGWNADFCLACDHWVDRYCREKTCDMCLSRPPRPSLVDSPMEVLALGGEA